ncbi:MAG: amidohydrolase family protein [Niveispirillum sp.]|uniref:amidohydrolase family protein n=1 Tax=Niveispirillum sp. TaxID=1917217 RepID=UPI004036D77E
MTSLPIVDPHMHLWDFTRQHYSWLMDRPLPSNAAGNVEPIAKPYGLSEYLADTAGFDVRGLVHVEAGASTAHSLAETQWLQGVADEGRLPMALVAFAALNDPDVEKLLAAHAEHGAVRGIRHIINWHSDPARTYSTRDVIGDADWQRGYALLAKYVLSFDLQIYPSQMAVAAELAARHPDIPVILNHAGMPTDQDADGLALWRKGLALLAAQPNVAIKISGLAMIDRQWTVDSLRPFVLHAIDAFGTDRAMFASNFPVDKLYGGFGAHYAAYDAITADFTDAERRAMFAGNAARLYRLAVTL